MMNLKSYDTYDGVSVGDYVRLKKRYGNYPEGMILKVVSINGFDKPFLLSVSEGVVADVKMMRNGVVAKLMEKPDSLRELVPIGTKVSFTLDPTLSGESGHGSILLNRNEFIKIDDPLDIEVLKQWNKRFMDFGR